MGEEATAVKPWSFTVAAGAVSDLWRLTLARKFLSLHFEVFISGGS
jgi:hypothetical protein